MRRALALLLVLVACDGLNGKVDAGLIGTWDLMVPNAQGVARWVWDIRGNGTYDFHAEGPGDVPSHHGTFAAKSGRYTLRSTTSFVWADTGTYVLADVNTLSATGKLGTASWSRVGEKATVRTKGTVPDVVPDGSLSSAIYSYLRTHPADASVLPATYASPRTDAAPVEAQATSDGVIGVVKTVAQSPNGPGEISFMVFRSQEAAESAYAAYAVFDSPKFRNIPGDLVTSYTSNFKERGKAQCISRVHNGSTDASVDCFLLMVYPVRDPVILVGTVRVQRTSTSGELPRATIERGNDLVFAGIQHWDSSLPGIMAKMNR